MEVVRTLLVVYSTLKLLTCTTYGIGFDGCQSDFNYHMRLTYLNKQMVPRGCERQNGDTLIGV